MPDREKVLGHLYDCLAASRPGNLWVFVRKAIVGDALELLTEQEKEIKALHLLVEWAEECDFGFDQFYDEYKRYKDEINDMKYIDGMIHVAKRTLEDNRAFEEGGEV